MRNVLSSKGFTLVEILAVLFVIIATGTVCTDFYRDHISSVRRQEALETLTNLNGAIDLYRSEFGDLPPGGNDAGHHQNILSLLNSTSYGRQLLESQSVCLAQLESTGHGENFRFTKYKGVDAPVAMLSTESTVAGLTPNAWTRDNDGIENIPVPTEETPLANSAAEARLASNSVHGSVTFDQPGKYEWIVPDGVTQIQVEGIGGGGSGSVATHWEGWGANSTMKIPFGVCLKDDGNWDKYVYATHTVYIQGPCKIKNIDSRTDVLLRESPKWSGCHVWFSRTQNYGSIGWLYGSFSGFPEANATSGYPYPLYGEVVEWKTTEKRCYPGFCFLVNNTTSGACHAWSCCDPGHKLYNVANQAATPNSFGHGSWFHSNYYFQYKRGTLDLDIQRWEVRDTPGKGGKAGQYQQNPISGLKGGESVFIFVGKGGIDTNGENSRVFINGQPTIYAGGAQAIQAATAGETNASLGLSGNGGQGQAHYNTHVDRRGKNGCVRITY